MGRMADQNELGNEVMGAFSGGKDNSFPFDAMKLKVGDRLQVQLPELLSSERSIVRLIGYVSNVSLLVTPPRDASGFRFKLLENDPLVVRIFSSQNAFGFSTSVMKIVNSPFEYLHLDFPGEVMGMVIRKAPRVKTQIICSVVTQESAEGGIPGLLVNLSANGALLDSRKPVAQKGERIKLSFRITLHAVDSMLSLEAIVRSQYTDEAVGNAGERMVHHGLEFVGLEPNDTLILQSMIYQQMVEQPSSVI